MTPGDQRPTVSLGSSVITHTHTFVLNIHEDRHLQGAKPCLTQASRGYIPMLPCLVFHKQNSMSEHQTHQTLRIRFLNGHQTRTKHQNTVAIIVVILDYDQTFARKPNHASPPASQPNVPVHQSLCTEFMTLGLKPTSPASCCASSSVCVWEHHTPRTADAFPPQGAFVSHWDWREHNGMRSIHLLQKLKQAEWSLKRSTRCYLKTGLPARPSSIFSRVRQRTS